MQDKGDQTLNNAVLLLPRIHIQNANAISSPLTWGFPSITAFTGLMTALERRLAEPVSVQFCGVGVVCHNFEAQVSKEDFTQSFNLARHPITKEEKTASIVEEGRVHLNVSMIFHLTLTHEHISDAARSTLASRIMDTLSTMRVAGGSVLPKPPDTPDYKRCCPVLELIPDAEDEQHKQFRRLARKCLPGFALVARDDLLQKKLTQLRKSAPEASVLDAWLELSRWNSRAVTHPESGLSTETGSAQWITDPRPGWLVPIPVGFAGISQLYESGTVAAARDTRIPFRFVESIWSIGQWVSPHRMRGLRDLLWYSDTTPADQAIYGLYRCRNHYEPISTAEALVATS